MVIRSGPLLDLTTASEVIDALGGTAKTATLAAPFSPKRTCSLQSVTNWRSNGRLAPYTFLIFKTELEARGFSAPPMLWSIAPAPEPAGSVDHQS
jgi:hypothetical protein